MLDLKQIPYELVDVMPGTQRAHLRLAGFRGGTVPALKINGRRIQGSLAISRELEAIKPEPRLFPADPAERRAVEDAERWGEQELQGVPRRIFRWGLARDLTLRTWLAALDGRMPAPGIAARLSAPVSRYYAWVADADDDHVKRDIAALPGLLDHVDELIASGAVPLDNPNAATLQIMSTVRSLLGFEDFSELVESHSYAPVARELFPAFPSATIPRFVERLGAA